MAERLPPDLSLNEMRTLIAISEEGTFTAAAKQLGISQPAVSRQLVRMEERLGLWLVDRDFRQPTFTASGERLLQYARVTVRNFERVMSSLQADCLGLVGELRLEASTPYRCTEWIKDFGLRNPSVNVSVLFSDSKSVEEDVLDGTADFGLIGRCPRTTGLPYREVGEDEVVLAVPLNHPFASRGEIDLNELEDQAFITCIHRELGAAGPVKTTLSKFGLEQPPRQIVMTLQSDNECVQAVAKGIGLAWVTNVLFERKHAGAVPVRIKGFRFERTLYLIQSARPLGPVGRAFLECLPPDKLTPGAA